MIIKNKYNAEGQKSYLPSATEIRIFLYGGAIIGIIAAVAYGFYMYKTRIQKT